MIEGVMYVSITWYARKGKR